MSGIKIAFYKGTRKGVQGAYSKLARFVDGGIYSHCEVIFSDGISASSSFIDKGVRFKRIEYNSENWDVIEVPSVNELQVRQWFEEHEGDKYDILGNLRFGFFFIKDSRNKFFCSEAIAEAIGLKDAYRYGPNGLYSLLTSDFIKHK